MKPKTIHSIFFSPTGTSRTIAQTVTLGISGGKEVELDLTRKSPKPTTFPAQDVVVIAMPVYGGRLPTLAVERFQSLEGNQTPAVAIVVYGNRAYEDALAELCDLCATQGFKVVSAAAFVGQHSFSSEKLPIAHGRPDQADLHLAKQFGKQTRKLLENDSFLDPKILPRDHPFKAGSQPTVPATGTDEELCIHCGACVTHCPVPCIEMVNHLPRPVSDGFIWCMACVQTCPTGARRIILPKIHESAQRLHENFSARQEPEIFQPMAEPQKKLLATKEPKDLEPQMNANRRE